MARFYLIILILIFTQGANCKSSTFYTLDQFSPFLESGFTSDMIVGGKKVYHKEKYYDISENAEMILWTIIGKDVYVERNPHYRLGDH